MNCTTCGEPALGTSLAGQAYCHRRECFDWKMERIKLQDARQARLRALELWMRQHSLWGF